MREIMADKLISLPATERYVRHRDIWDLAWIAQQRTSIDFSLVARKVEDYRLTDYRDRLERMVERLPDIVFS
ncbi:nucleotidyl transferase AbiEii/AbiGii toxin family protein, partial [Priestia megaterium]|uniref:nucleotidyl transferase AbiEii/AbiGii toxin family protein n=1 Tax=Priestia megaterium TaxID=1404 RepID=UPI0035B62074